MYHATIRHHVTYTEMYHSLELDIRVRSFTLASQRRLTDSKVDPRLYERPILGRSLAQHFAPALEAACLPHQYGLSTRAGAEAVPKP